MFDQVIRDGSCQVNPLLPPSANCSTSIWAPRPEQVWKAPRSLPPMVSRKKTVLANTLSVIGVLLEGGSGAVVAAAGSFPALPQVGPQQPADGFEQPAGQLVQVGRRCLFWTVAARRLSHRASPAPARPRC